MTPADHKSLRQDLNARPGESLSSAYRRLEQEKAELLAEKARVELALKMAMGRPQSPQEKA